MTLDIHIGPLTREKDCEYVDRIELPEAPAFPGAELSHRANRISVPYCALDDLVAVSEGIAALVGGGAPDLRVLQPLDLIEVTIGRLFYEWEHPRARPAFDGDGAQGLENATLARLLLLEWWIGWALAHLDRPVLERC